MTSGDTSSAHTAPPSMPGARVFAGRYALLDKLGSGGFGTVYRAHDQHLRIEVALKLTNAEVTDAGVLQRFQREAHVIARLNHENIIKIFDFGVHEGTPFYTMEFVAGDTLHKLMEVNRYLPLRAAARITRDVALALHHAHINGITHRDVKPHNIIVQPRSETSSAKKPDDAKSSFTTSKGVLTEYRVVLTDFGLAKDRAASAKLSVTGEVMGTPHYMPPEQAMGESAAVGPRSDVYSLGVTLYFMLSGKLPFGGGSMPEILANIVTHDPAPLKRAAPHLPDDLCTIVHKAMDKDPNHRYKSALAFAEDCENFLKGDPISARPPSFTVKMRRFVRRNLAACASAGSAVLVAAAAAGWFGFAQPAMRERAARAQLEAERARIEGAAHTLLDQARDRYEKKDFTSAVAVAEKLLAAHGQHARRPGYRIPVVDASLLAAHAYERQGRAPDAARFHLRAHFSAPDSAEALFELAHFYLRRNEFNHAIYFFTKLLGRDDRARYCIGFAHAGASDFDAAVAAFEAALKTPLPAALPSFHEMRPSDTLTPMYELPPSREILQEALDLCSTYAFRTEVKMPRTSHVGVADLDADGRDELLAVRGDRLDVYGAKGASVELLRSIASPIAKLAWPVPYDFDGDGKPELIIPIERGMGVFRIAGDRLEQMYDGDEQPNTRFLVAGDLDGDKVPELFGGGSQWLTAFRLDGRRYVRFFEHHHQATDVGHLEVRDFDGDGTPEILVITTTWGLEGFRLSTWQMRGGRLVRSATRAVGLVSGHIAVPEPGATTFYFTTWSDGGVGRTIEARYRQLKIPPPARAPARPLRRRRVLGAGHRVGAGGRPLRRLPHGLRARAREGTPLHRRQPRARRGGARDLARLPRPPLPLAPGRADHRRAPRLLEGPRLRPRRRRRPRAGLVRQGRRVPARTPGRPPGRRPLRRGGARTARERPRAQLPGRDVRALHVPERPPVRQRRPLPARPPAGLPRVRKGHPGRRRAHAPERARLGVGRPHAPGAQVEVLPRHVRRGGDRRVARARARGARVPDAGVRRVPRAPPAPRERAAAVPARPHARHPHRARELPGARLPRRPLRLRRAVARDRGALARQPARLRDRLLDRHERRRLPAAQLRGGLPRGARLAPRDRRLRRGGGGRADRLGLARGRRRRARDEHRRRAVRRVDAAAPRHRPRRGRRACALPARRAGRRAARRVREPRLRAPSRRPRVPRRHGRQPGVRVGRLRGGGGYRRCLRAQRRGAEAAGIQAADAARAFPRRRRPLRERGLRGGAGGLREGPPGDGRRPVHRPRALQPRVARRSARRDRARPGRRSCGSGAGRRRTTR